MDFLIEIFLTYLLQPMLVGIGIGFLCLYNKSEGTKNQKTQNSSLFSPPQQNQTVIYQFPDYGSGSSSD